MKEFDKLVDIISQLREECPWDKEQTHESLSKHLIEEAYELLDSLAKLNNNNQESYRNLSSELGDLLLQILLHSKIASENGYFSIVEVVDSLNEKLIKRHPHVFGDVSLDSPKEVEKQWEKIKQEDKQSIFDDINKNLPAITTAFKAQRKAESLNLSYKNYEEALEDLISEKHSNSPTTDKKLMDYLVDNRHSSGSSWRMGSCSSGSSTSSNHSNAVQNKIQKWDNRFSKRRIK